METLENLEPPKRPAPDECCLGGGCHDCVWKEYEKKLDVYLTAKELLKEKTKKLQNNHK